MKLLYITNGITGAGGLERVLAVKTAALTEDYGYEIHLVSLNERGKQPFYAFSPRLHFHSLQTQGNVLSYFTQYHTGIQNAVSEVKPDVIIVCDDALKGFFLPLLIRTPAKWVYESHASFLLADRGKGISVNKQLQHAVKQALGWKFSKIILLTESNRKEWRTDNLEVIPNPLPFSSLRISNLQNKRVIAVGSYSYNKGYDRLLEIWAEVSQQTPDWRLDIFGRGVAENVATLAESRDLKNIFFHDPVAHIENEYARSSVFVLPSRSEGFGMVLIEAMACGVPVISFDCPNGPRHIITDGADGFLVENGNVKAFAEKLTLLMTDREPRTEMGRRAKENVQRYAVEKVVKKWNALFREITGKA